jgi:hypothetical protein
LEAARDWPLFLTRFQSHPVGIGNHSSQPGVFNFPFRGRIDELSVYSRALSASEVQAIYNADGAGKCPLGTAPSIITQPASLAVLAGSNATFAATAAGTPPLSYQWRFNGTNLAGATSTSLTLANVQPAQAGNYSVRVTNTFGSVISSNALLTVTLPPTCVPPPSGLVSWWPGEGTASDAVDGASGTLSGGATFAAGRVGQCFAFDGVGGGVNVPDVPALALTNSLTIECWLFVTNAPSVPGMVLFRGDTRSGLDPYYVSVEPRAGTSGVLNFIMWNQANATVYISSLMPTGA